MLKIRNKKTGEIVEITDPKQLAKYGLKVPKAQWGMLNTQESDYTQAPQQMQWGYNPSYMPTDNTNLTGAQPINLAQNSGFNEQSQGQGFNPDTLKPILQGVSTTLQAVQGHVTTAGNIFKNNRTKAWETGQLYDALKQPYDNQFSEDMYGSNQGLQLLSAKYGAAIDNISPLSEQMISKFSGNKHYEGGIPINTNLDFLHANDMKTNRKGANLEVEDGEYFIPMAEEGSSFVASDVKKLGRNGKSPSELIEIRTKEETGISANDFTKKITKREKFVNKNKNFLNSKTSKDTTDIISMLSLPKIETDKAIAREEIFNQELKKYQLGKPNDLNTFMMKYGGNIKDNITKIGNEYYNQDIIDGIERDNRVNMNKWQNNLNRFGVTTDEEFYKKFPTEELFNFEMGRRYGNSIGSRRPSILDNELFMKYGGKLPKARNGWENLTFKEKLEWYKNSPLFNKDFFNENEFIANLDDPFWDDLYKENYKLYPPSKNVQLNTSPVINSVNQTVSTTNANPNTQRDLSWLKPFTSKTKVGKTTPTNVDLQGLPPQPVDWNYVANKWMDINPNINSPIELQEEMYDYWLDKYQLGTPQEKQESLKQFKTMWGTFGEVKFNSKNPPKGISKNWKNWKVDDKSTYDDLARLRGNFMDAKLEARYLLPTTESQQFTPKSKTPLKDDEIKLQSRIKNKTDKTASDLNIPQFFPMGLPVIGGEEAAARFQIPDRNVPFRRISPQQQLNEINRNTRAGLSLLGNTPTDVSNISNLLTQANIQGQQAINTTNQQNIQNQMNIDQINTQLSRQRDLAQLQEDVRFTENIAKRKGLMQTEANMNKAAYNQNWMNVLKEQRDKDFVEKIYPSKAWENVNFQMYDPTKYTLTPKEEKKKEKKYGGKIKLKSKSSK